MPATSRGRCSSTSTTSPSPAPSLPHMIPSAERFAAKMAERGIGNDDRVIVYDTVGLSSAGRAWWMLRLFGHDNVALARRRAAALEGRGPAARHRRADHPAAPLHRPFPARSWCATRRRCSPISGSHREQVVDARAAGRFEGTAEETWPGRRRGHIPGSRNLPFDQVTDPQTRQLQQRRGTAPLFDEAGVRLDRPDRHQLRLRRDRLRGRLRGPSARPSRRRGL